jgi:eukaryotic-like serine/threonine-protein kinase
MSGRVLAERYELHACVAIGGMGEIWRGRDRLLRRPVAVKLIKLAEATDPLAAARFQAEARCGARLCHPGIVKVYDYCEADRPFLVLEWVDGSTLAQILAAGPVEPRRALYLTSQVAWALSAAHTAGIIHQDVKPANVLISSTGEVKLADFGIAQRAGSAPLNCAGTVSGTAAYLAPERTRGEQASPAADLYSLGVVLYECLAGQRPFAGSAQQIATAHQIADVPPLPTSVPPAVSQLVAELMAKDPRSRPASAKAAARAASRLRSQVDQRRSCSGSQDRSPGRLVRPPSIPTLIDTLRPGLIGALPAAC